MKRYGICGILVLLAVTVFGCAGFSDLKAVAETGRSISGTPAAPSVPPRAHSSLLKDGIDFFISEQYAINLSIAINENRAEPENGAVAAGFDFDGVCPVVGCKYYF